MSSGMRIDPKGLPLHMQEQVGVAIVNQMAQAVPVAGREESEPAAPMKNVIHGYLPGVRITKPVSQRTKQSLRKAATATYLIRRCWKILFLMQTASGE